MPSRLTSRAWTPWESRLVAGSNFRHEQIQPPLTRTDASRFVPQIIISRALGEHLFPQQNPLGRQVFDTLNQTATIIGVVDHVMGNFPDSKHPDWVFFLPRLPDDFIVVHYIVRTRPGQRDTVMRSVEAHLSQSNADRVINFVRPLTYFKNLSYLADSSMEIYLLTVTGARDRCDLSRYLRARNVQRQHSHQADRHAPRSRRTTTRYRALLPGRERPDHQQRRHRGLRTGAGRPATGCRCSMSCRALTSTTSWVACCCCGASASSPPGSPHAGRRRCRPRSRRARYEGGVMLASRAMKPDATFAAASSLAGRTILVIDDSEAVRTAFEVLLSLHGAQRS